MKLKILIFIPLFICAYGWFPVSFNFLKARIKTPNTLLITHQECGCPCPDASIKDGLLIIPTNILNKHSNISRNEINLSGRNPFATYDASLAQEEIIVTGKVVTVDTILCGPDDCELAANFKIDEWEMNNYYPRFWTHGRYFAMFFFISCVFSMLIICVFLFTMIEKLLKQNSG